MPGLLGPQDIRELAAALDKRPTKTLGQNFVHDAGTVRRIVREAGIGAGDRVLEIGPGLGSLTLAILEVGASLSAVEIDPVLASALPATIHARMPEAEGRFALRLADALTISSPEDLAELPADPGVFEPEFLVANLPYNVAVPIVLTLLEALPSLRSVTVMVQAEVADRLAAQPGSRTYGVPSVKAAWYGTARRGVKISRNIFWPVPNVDSALVHLDVWTPEQALALRSGVSREDVFAVIDAAFAQRRKTLRSALSTWAGSSARAEEILAQAGVSPSERGEKLRIDDFIAVARAGGDLAHS